MNPQDKEYEPYCFIKKERSPVIGGTLVLLVSQFVYHLNPKLDLIGYVILIIVGLLLSSFLKRIPDEDVMESLKNHKELDKKSKKDTIIVTSLFRILAGF